MKKLSLMMLAFMALSLHPVQSNAQAPQKFNYQGIARDAKGNPVGKQTLGRPRRPPHHRRERPDPVRMPPKKARTN